jgi:hypothetical protein
MRSRAAARGPQCGRRGPGADPRPAPLGVASVGATTIGDDESPFEIGGRSRPRRTGGPSRLPGAGRARWAPSARAGAAPRSRGRSRERRAVRAATGRGRRGGGAWCPGRWRRESWPVLRVRELRCGRARRGRWMAGGGGTGRSVSDRTAVVPPPEPVASPLPPHTARPAACHTSGPDSVARGRRATRRLRRPRPWRSPRRRAGNSPVVTGRPTG